MNKIIKTFAILFCAAILTGCATLENVVVLNATTGQNLFVRNTTIKTKNSIITNLEFDLTVSADKNQIIKDPVLNYTVTAAPKSYDEAETVKFYLINDGKSYGLVDKEFMYRAINKKKFMDVRYTATVNLDDFNQIMNNFLPVEVMLVLSDGTEIKLSSDEINDKFNDLRMIVK